MYLNIRINIKSKFIPFWQVWTGIPAHPLTPSHIDYSHRSLTLHRSLTHIMDVINILLAIVIHSVVLCFMALGYVAMHNIPKFWPIYSQIYNTLAVFVVSLLALIVGAMGIFESACLFWGSFGYFGSLLILSSKGYWDILSPNSEIGVYALCQMIFIISMLIGLEAGSIMASLFAVAFVGSKIYLNLD